MVVGLPDGPPLKKFQKGQEKEAQEWAECVPGWRISFNGKIGKYEIGFVPHNMAQVSRGPSFYSLEAAKSEIYRHDPQAIITVS